MDGLTDYFTINSGSVDMRSALWEQLPSGIEFQLARARYGRRS